MKITSILVLVFSYSTTDLFACQFDTDCGVGSKCVKQNFQLYGICAGGINPGNDYNRKPATGFGSLNDKVGDTCSFNTDCNIGHTCLKSAGSIRGVCTK